MALWRLLGRGAPARPPLPPAHLREGLGQGDFWQVGEDTAELVERLVGIRTDDRVLDVGCGLGRIAWPLSKRLGRAGRYAGFDVARPNVDWCRGHLGLDRRRFAFHHADVRTAFYNEGGAIAAEEFRFPWPEGSFSLAIATSLFTHLAPAAAARYLHEVARTLEPGGRLFASFFLLDAEGLDAVRSGFSFPRFTAAIEHGLVADPAVPEAAVAHDHEWVMGRCAAAGLAVTAVHPGQWKDPASLKVPPGLYYQDLVVAVRS